MELFFNLLELSQGKILHQMANWLREKKYISNINFFHFIS